jgi:hypothetical protein
LTNLGESLGGETMTSIMGQIMGPLMKNVLSAVKDSLGGSLKKLDGVLENLDDKDGKVMGKVKGLFGK